MQNNPNFSFLRLTYKHSALLLILLFILGCDSSDKKNQKLKALIIVGQNNHYVWPKTTKIIESYLKETELFDVEIKQTDSIWLGIKYNKNRPGNLEKYIEDFPLNNPTKNISTEPIKTSRFHVDFNKYDLVISNLGANTADWPDDTKKDFENYMRRGGGLVVIHAANNAWGDWSEFNQMIGLGAWGNRDSVSGSYAYYNKGKLKIDSSIGIVGSHGLEHEFLITTRDLDHPIMKDLPKEWLHAQDELYDRMRGPFQNATILATAYSNPQKNKQPWEPIIEGSGYDVPTLITVNYGKGRIFHTTLGHFDYSMDCVGFMTTLQRGAEWAATGKVTQKIPKDFPTKDKSSSRIWN